MKAAISTPIVCVFISIPGSAASSFAPVNPPSEQSTLPVTLGQSVVALNGPWKFHVGDDPRWADSKFDDSSWQSYELAPDVPKVTAEQALQLPPLPGWQHYGHMRYAGYAWYRIRLTIEPGSRS